MKRHLYTILLPVAAALALSGCTTGSEEADEHYIKLSDAVCTFTEDGGEAQIIEVRANPEWSFESGASWLKVSAGEGSTLEVSVDPNADGERNAEITLQAGEATASIRVYQLGARGLSARYRLLEQLNSAVMSPSGRYVGGFYTDVLGENGFQYTAVVIDLETDKWHEFGPYPETLFGFTEAEVVTDQGVLYISDSTNGGCVAFDLDGTYTVPKSVAGYGPLVMQSSSVDGSVMVGYTEGTPYGCMYGPVKVVDGEVKSDKAYFDTFDLPEARVYTVAYAGTNAAGTFRKSFEVQATERPLEIGFSNNDATIACKDGAVVEIIATVKYGGTGVQHEWKVDGETVSTDAVFSRAFDGKGPYTIAYHAVNSKQETVDRTWTVTMVPSGALFEHFEDYTELPKWWTLKENQPGIELADNPKPEGINTSRKVLRDNVSGEHSTSGYFNLKLKDIPADKIVHGHPVQNLLGQEQVLPSCGVCRNQVCFGKQAAVQGRVGGAGVPVRCEPRRDEESDIPSVAERERQ